MLTFTVFCRESSGTGTMWIGSVQACDPATAKEAGREKCADDWGFDLEGVAVVGVAAGDIEILSWDDDI